MFQIINYSKIVVDIRQHSNILGFLVNVLTEKRPWEEQAEFYLQQSAQVSPAIILITRGAPDGGVLQSWLFTSRSWNLVSGKLRSSGFWSYSNFLKWNRVKMTKNGPKMAEIFLGASHMINNNIFSIFCFLTFSLGYF